MFCAYDRENETLIAIHEEKRVVKIYCDLIKKYHNKELFIVKIKNKKYKNLKDTDDIYLVRYADSYVQKGYLQYLDFASLQIKEDHIQCKDVLIRILSSIDLSNKEVKYLSNAVVILDNIIKEDNEFIPDLDELNTLKQQYDPYMYNAGIWI